MTKAECRESPNLFWFIGVSSVRSLNTHARRPSLRQCVTHDAVGRRQLWLIPHGSRRQYTETPPPLAAIQPTRTAYRDADAVAGRRVRRVGFNGP